MVVLCDNHGHDGGNRMLLIRPWKPYMKQGYAITSKEELKLEMYRMALGLWADMLKVPEKHAYHFVCEHPSPPAQLGCFA